MFTSPSQVSEDGVKPSRGPFGYGDPDDKKLRKVEKSIIIPKLVRNEAEKKCAKTLKIFLDCAKEEGILFSFKCREANDANNQCILSYAKNPEFIEEVTARYLEARRHYRLTGEPLEKYDRKKKSPPFTNN